MDSDPKIKFTALSGRAASVQVTGSSNRLSKLFDPTSFHHSITFARTPIITLAQRFAPDEKWEIIRHAKHATLPENSDCLWSDPGLNGFFKPLDLNRCKTLMSELPDGDYLILRSGVQPKLSEQILLGNERVANDFKALVLLGFNEPVYSIVLSPDIDQYPDLTQPLLGIAILNYCGTEFGVKSRQIPCQHAILFLPLFATRNTAPAKPTTDIIAVVPLKGLLCIDTLGVNVVREEIGKRWHDEFSSLLIQKLAVPANP